MKTWLNTQPLMGSTTVCVCVHVFYSLLSYLPRSSMKMSGIASGSSALANGLFKMHWIYKGGINQPMAALSILLNQSQCYKEQQHCNHEGLTTVTSKIFKQTSLFKESGLLGPCHHVLSCVSAEWLKGSNQAERKWNKVCNWIEFSVIKDRIAERCFRCSWWTEWGQFKSLKE